MLDLCSNIVNMDSSTFFSPLIDLCLHLFLFGFLLFDKFENLNLIIVIKLSRRFIRAWLVLISLFIAIYIMHIATMAYAIRMDVIEFIWNRIYSDFLDKKRKFFQVQAKEWMLLFSTGWIRSVSFFSWLDCSQPLRIPISSREKRCNHLVPCFCMPKHLCKCSCEELESINRYRRLFKRHLGIESIESQILIWNWFDAQMALRIYNEFLNSHWRIISINT